MLRRGLAACGVLVATGLATASPTYAVAPPTPWDGTNPFHCTVQDAGFGTTVPDPGADPFCVHFDKTNQNISQLGIVDFLTKEPARVALAVPKCFYYQEDHWRGSVIQSDPSTVLYEFTGHYFFNKATGDGGAWLTGFSVLGQPLGTGGYITHDEIPVDPQCAAQAAAPHPRHRTHHRDHRVHSPRGA